MSLTQEEEERLHNLLQTLEGCTKALSDWERNFLADQSNRYQQYGSKIFMSPKQWAVLQRMYEKVTEHDPSAA